MQVQIGVYDVNMVKFGERDSLVKLEVYQIDCDVVHQCFGLNILTVTRD